MELCEIIYDMGQYHAKYREKDDDEDEPQDDNSPVIVRFGDLFQVIRISHYEYLHARKISNFSKQRHKLNRDGETKEFVIFRRVLGNWLIRS